MGSSAINCLRGKVDCASLISISKSHNKTVRQEIGMTKKRKTIFVVSAVIASLALITCILVLWAYKKMDTGYQAAMDPIRIRDGEAIAALVFEYEEKTGILPFEKEAAGAPFMVVIGHSLEDEDFYAKQDVLSRGAMFANSKDFESELERVLKRKIYLPKDPQKVASFAPNVYVYFLSDTQFSVAVHLFKPSEKSVEYKWRDGVFNSHAVTYSRKEEGEQEGGGQPATRPESN